MNSISEGIAPVVAVDRKSATPLHRQIYDGFRAAILHRELHPGQRVPSSRELAVELNLSRIPVLNAYAQLLAEGYFDSRIGAGTFVSFSLPEELTSFRARASEAPPTASGARPIARRAQLYPKRQNFPWAKGWGAFGLHQPALDRFPFRIWSKLAARHSRNPRIETLHHVDSLGTERLREAICSYLRTARAVRCEPERLMIVSGSQQALEITARVLLDPGDSVWFEEPGYWLARSVFLGAGCQLIPVPVDNDGMDVATGTKLCGDARVAYVTPSHQYPLGVTMSAARRMQLLNWAQASGSWIIEDDYDSEFRFASMPIASLQGLDRNARVIYIGTFSKVLFPSLRLGYIVIPADLVERFRAVRLAMDIFPPYLSQEIVADFMTEGHFARHIRRMRRLYGEQRAALVENLRREFGGMLEIHGVEAGMHLTVTVAEEVKDCEISMNAAQNGVWVWPLSPSYFAQPARQGFVLGYGSTRVADMPEAVRRLKAVLSGQRRGVAEKFAEKTVSLAGKNGGRQ